MMIRVGGAHFALIPPPSDVYLLDSSMKKKTRKSGVKQKLPIYKSKYIQFNRIKAVFFQYKRRIRGKKREKYDDKKEERKERKMYFVT
jgi:hypothetical protein